MDKNEAIHHFGTQQKLADALGIRQSTVSKWKRHIPYEWQLEIARLTRGVLQPDPLGEFLDWRRERRLSESA